MVRKAKSSSQSKGSEPVGNISGGKRAASETEAETNTSGYGSGTKQADSLKKVEGLKMTRSSCMKLCEKAFAQAADAKLEGNSAFKAGDYGKALLKYDLAIQTAPDGPLSTEIRSICYANRAACFSNMGKFEESIKECTKALELNTIYLNALLRRGEAREKLERYHESIADMTRILEFDQLNVQAKKNIIRLRHLAAKKREKMMGDAKGVDYISRLHEDVLACILSHLPFKEAVRTSVLSKAWELRWTSLSNMGIDGIDKDPKDAKDVTILVVDYTACQKGVTRRQRGV